MSAVSPSRDAFSNELKMRLPGDSYNMVVVSVVMLSMLAGIPWELASGIYTAQPSSLKLMSVKEGTIDIVMVP